MAGEVIGITTLFLKGGENLNFAIPVNDAKGLLLNHPAQLQALPNEPEPAKTQKQPNAEDASPSVPIGSVKTAVNPRGYYKQLSDAGGFSGAPPSYVCFSDDPSSGSFFTFRAFAYDAEYYNAEAKIRVMIGDRDPNTTYATPEEKKLLEEQLDIMTARESTASYITFLSKDWLKTFSPEVQKFFRSGGRILATDIYDKGVRTSSLYYKWDGTSWFLPIPPADPKAYTRTSKMLRLSVEAATMRYVESMAETITVGWGETAATDTTSHGPWDGVCEKIPNPK